MNQDTKNIPQPCQEASDRSSKSPDEGGNIQIDGFVRISDPNTKEIIVEVRE